VQIALFGQKNAFVEKREHLFDQILFAEKLLSETEDFNNNALVRLKIIKNKISYRKAIVETFNKEISYIDEKINSLKLEQETLQVELNDFKKEYEQLIYYAYKNKSAYNKLMFILSAETFKQAYKRLKYLEQYTIYRKRQILSIQQKSRAIDKTIVELEERKQSKLVLIDNRLRESEVLEAEQLKEQQAISGVGEVLLEIESDIDSENESNDLLDVSMNNFLDDINEIGSNAKATSEFGSTESNKIVSEKFLEKKGELLPPVEKGLIVNTFGENAHPDFPNLIIRNDGIDILTVSGSVIRAIFTGLVVKVIDIPGLNKSVLIKHGDYYSLYSNLINVNVSENELVEVGQEIGIVFTDKFEDNSSILKFQIWSHKEKQNPQDWISEF
jgi:murein DD-endopeptidase MepM/ murein hydrolase activator NlpD